MNLLGISLRRPQNFKGSLSWQAFSVVTVWSDRRKAHFLLLLSVLLGQPPAASLRQVPPKTAGLPVLFAVQPKTVRPPPTIIHYSSCQLEPFYSFHGNLYPAPALHEIYTEIRRYFFPFVTLSQGQFKKNLHSIQLSLLCISVMQIYLEAYPVGAQTGH